MGGSQALAPVALVIVALPENGRIPVDNSATHLEPTMVHEAMVLVYSGRHRAMIELAASLKLMLYLAMIACVFLPVGMSATPGQMMLPYAPCDNLKFAVPVLQDGNVNARIWIRPKEMWLRIAGGVIDRCHPRDAPWFQWPLLEAVIEGSIVADFPLCNKSFNCSCSGHDL